VHGRTDGDAVGGGDVVGALVAHVPPPCVSCANDDTEDSGERRPPGYESGVRQVAAGNLCSEICASVDVHLGVDAYIRRAAVTASY
jgi:hypothetical protein